MFAAFFAASKESLTSFCVAAENQGSLTLRHQISNVDASHRPLPTGRGGYSKNIQENIFSEISPHLTKHSRSFKI